MEKASFVIKSKNVFTAEADEPCPGAIIVTGERIAAVLPYEADVSAYVDDKTRVVDCDDKLVMPGFVDSHVHFIMTAVAGTKYQCNLIGAASAEECVQRLQEHYRTYPDLSFLYGFGCSSDGWGTYRLPTKDILDAAFPDIPVINQTIDGHNFWANSKAFEVCGITKDTTVPYMGYGKDENDELNGASYELVASFPLTAKTVDLEMGEIKELAAQLMSTMSSYGVTSVGDVSGFTSHPANYKEIQAYDELDHEIEGGLPVRMFVYPSLDYKGSLDYAKALREKYQSNKVKLAGLKQFVDGIPMTGTIFTSDPAFDDPERNRPFFTQELLGERIKEANREGFSVRLHTIGDRAITMGLDMFEASQKECDASKVTNTLEHCTTIVPQNMDRFAGLGVVASMQPSVMQFFPGIPEDAPAFDAEQGKMVCRSILKHGGVLSLSTDAPCVTIDPFLTLYMGVTRRSSEGTLRSSLRDESLTLGEALRAYTYGSARAMQAEDSIGTLAEGKLADIVVLDRPLFGQVPEEILHTTVELTMCDGKVVYERASRRRPWE